MALMMFGGNNIKPNDSSVVTPENFQREHLSKIYQMFIVHYVQKLHMLHSYVQETYVASQSRQIEAMQIGNGGRSNWLSDLHGSNGEIVDQQGYKTFSLLQT